MIYASLLLVLPLASLPSKEALPLPPPPSGLKLLQPVEKRALVQTGLVDPEDVPAEAEMEALRALEEVALTPGAEDAQTVALLQTLRTFGPSHPLRLRLEDVLVELDHREGGLAEVPPVGDLMAFDVTRVQDRYDIPVEMQPLVAHYIRFFQGPGRKWFRRWMARSTRYLPVMQPILEQYGLPKDTVYVAMIESGFSTRAYSWAHAAGPWQFIPTTGREYGLRQDFWVDERRDPIKATHSAARFLRTLHRNLGHWYLAWAGYNTGGTRVRRLVERRGTSDFWELIEGRGLMEETQHYVPKVIAAALVAKNPTTFGFSPDEFDFLPPLEFDTVHLPDPTDLAVIAQAVGISVDELQELNPELNRWCTPPASEEKPYALRLPKGAGPTFAEAMAKLPPKARLSYVEHEVRRGDTLSKIAAVHGSTVDAILGFNRLSSPRALRVNSTLMIPVPKGASRSTVAATSSARAAESARSARRAPAPRAAASGKARTAPAPAPGTNVHVISSGDTLWSVSQRYGVSVDNLERWNDIRDHKAVRVGLRLRVSAP